MKIKDIVELGGWKMKPEDIVELRDILKSFCDKARKKGLTVKGSMELLTGDKIEHRFVV